MNSNIIKPKTLPGFMELLPNEQILFNKMKDTIRKSFEEHGFVPLNTPIIEDAKILLAKAGGETEKQIYRFNKGENDLALRFDLTVPLAKYVTQYYDKLQFPFKRYQIGKVYRGEKPQRGRFREFYQCDIDIIGDGKLSIINDAELPVIIYNTLKKLGFEEFTICINNRKLLNGLYRSLGLTDKSQEILRIVDKIEKIGYEKVKLELNEIASEDKVEKILEFISIDGTNTEKLDKLNSLQIADDLYVEGLDELTKIVSLVQDFGVPEANIKIDLSISRGLDYYTGTVYETFLNKYKNIGSICSGGRYDNLTEYYSTRQMPGVGISIGLSRLFYQLMENNIISAESEALSDVLVIPMIDDYSYCEKVASEFRKKGIRTQIYFEEQKIGKKFKYANNIKAEYVVVIGEDERTNNKITLKEMNTGNQETISITEAVERII